MPETRNPDPAPQPKTNEEPELVFEESIPSDGKDVVGEKMIEELGKDKADASPDSPPEPMPEQFPAS